jgi:hypothetical protein
VSTSIFSLAKHRYTLWIFLLAIVGVSTTRLVDFVFLEAANTLYHN